MANSALIDRKTLKRGNVESAFCILEIHCIRVAQWKRAGPITQRSVDRNHALLAWPSVSHDGRF